MYIPADYWQNRGKNYQHSESTEELEILQEFLKGRDIDTVLEVGSGNGRIFEYLGCPDNFAMVDFVDSFRENVKAKFGILPDKWDGKNLPYPDNSFDCLISFSVLLHVPYPDIDHFIQEHVRVAKKYVFIATCDTGSEYGIDEEHCFRHDYQTIFSKLGLRVMDMKVTNNGSRRIYILKKA